MIIKTEEEMEFEEDAELIDLTTVIQGSDSDDELLEQFEETTPSWWQVFKKMSGLSLPMALSYTFSFQIVFVIFLLNLISESEDEVAATALAATMMNLLVTLAESPLFSMGIIASMEKGEIDKAEKEGKSEEELESARVRLAGINRNGLMISAVVAPPIMASMIFSEKWLTGILGQDEATAQLAQNFLRPYSLAVPALQGQLCFEQLMFSFSHTKFAMGVGLTDLALGTALAAWLEFGGLGVPALGAAGVAYGYVIEAYLKAILFALYLGNKKEFSQYKFFNFLQSFSGNLTELGKLLKLSIPVSISIIASLLATTSTAIFAGLLGTLEQASWAFITGLSSFMLIFSAAFSQSNTQELARRIGAERFIEANRIGVYGLATTLIYIAPIPIIVAIEPDILMTIFNNDDDDISSILTYLVPIGSFSVLLSTASLNLLQQFRTLGESTKSTAIYSGGLVVGIGASYVLGLYTKMGIYGVAAGYALGNAIPLTVLGGWWGNRIRPSKIAYHQRKQESSGILLAKCSRHCFFHKSEKEELIDNDERFLRKSANGAGEGISLQYGSINS